MKELTIQEKAKAYDKVREKIAIRFGSNVAEEIFSEFEESEDERIRKVAIEFIRQNKSFNYRLGISKEDVIAWLENKGKEKPVISDDALREGVAHFGITQYQITNWLKKYVDVEKQGETSHQLEENSAAKDLDDELEAFLCKYEEVSDEEKARLIGVAEHFYLIGKNPNANL